MKITGLEIPTTQKDFVAAIWTRWLDSVRNILDVGRMLSEAKARLQHGEFLEMVERQLPFGPRAAQMLMAVAQNPILSNAKYISHLPPSWATLYELSRVPDVTLQAAISDGRIRPDLALHQAQKLWRELPTRDRAELYEIFACAICGEHKLKPDDTRPSTLGEDLEVRPRLYACEACGKTTLTEERVAGPFAKKTLPKTSRPVEGAVGKGSGTGAPQTEPA